MNEPKISVIIPLYNAEKYIRECLISVLASKFQDYEVLVIDDCSTDNSLAEVKKLMPHFDGRLKILSTEKNSGGAGVPRNIGIKNSFGKYVTFIDDDDFILPNAFGDFFELAEKFQADVVHTEKFLIFNDSGKDDFKWEKICIKSDEPHDEFVNEPFIETQNPNEKISRYIRGKFFWLPWGKFYRRDFLLENEITFPSVAFAEDMVFCFKCLCLAKNYLRVPNITNIHRILEGSTSKRICSSREGVRSWLGVVTVVVESVNEFMDTQKFFQENSDKRRAVLKFFIDKHFNIIKNLFEGLEPHMVQEIFFDELQNPELNQTGKNLVAAYLYAEKVLTR